nr:MAG TPA: Type III-A CRISPR-associated protein Csm1 complex, Type III-A, CRISPR-Cas.9A [Caudoviricetes sp.]
MSDIHKVLGPVHIGGMSQVRTQDVSCLHTR